jgi:hypothetical protein
MLRQPPGGGLAGQDARRAPCVDDLNAAAEAGVQLGRIRIDTETCERCAGHVKIIVEASNRCIEDPAVVERILAHLKSKAPSVGTALLPENRGPPQARLGAPASSTDSMTP